MESKLSVNNVYHNDWIIYDNRYFKVDITAKEFPCLQTTEFGIGVVDWNNIQPIKLTPEIMERIEGMESNPYNDTYNYDSVVINYCGIRNDFWINVERKVVDIVYLHQLQQLIRLFTNKEIELKWEK